MQRKRVSTSRRKTPRKQPRKRATERRVANAYRRLAQLRGKVVFSIDLDVMRNDRA